ncbi:MAG: sigma-70 family RNA polymerase sigma factor [Blastocatellia bacterium]|nr:sigma-70 family RNA polymerase sigma factor [Blastocatellia bacterium]
MVRKKLTCRGILPTDEPRLSIYFKNTLGSNHQIDSEQQANNPGGKEGKDHQCRRNPYNFKLIVALAVHGACTPHGYRHGYSLEKRMIIPPVTQEPQTTPRSNRSKRKLNWTLTQESIAKLLAHLGDNAEKAGLAYQELRCKLIIFFECNRCADAEELADVTLNRIARKLSEGEAINKPMLYALSVARYVLYEYWRRPELSAIPLDESIQEIESNYSTYVVDARAQHEAEMRREECMRRCLMQLPDQQRELLTDYYTCEKGSMADHRRKMAERLRITPNALSIQVHRLRGKLINSLEESLKRD